MMDGISAMDTGNNGQMLSMNIESIAEVKVLTQGYQAEYGRSSGLQITAVTKSGTNRFRGSAYDIEHQLRLEREHAGPTSKNGDRQAQGHDAGPWATRSAVRSASPAATTSCSSSTATSTGRRQRRSTAAIRSASACRPRSSAPATSRRRSTTTATLFNLIKDPQLARRLHARPNTPACFQDGGVLGKIPANRLYPAGIALLNRYPLPNVDAGRRARNYNYEIPSGALPSIENLTQQPAIRVDYQLSPKLRVHRQVLRPARSASSSTPGTIPGFNDVLIPYPFITELRRHRQLHAEPDDVHRRHLRVHPQPAGRRRIEAAS